MGSLGLGGRAAVKGNYFEFLQLLLKSDVFPLKCSTDFVYCLKILICSLPSFKKTLR